MTMKYQETNVRKATHVSKQEGNRATIGETIALTAGVSVAFTCAAIGAWSMLAFFSSVGQYGVLGLISGFFRAVSGQ